MKSIRQALSNFIQAGGAMLKRGRGQDVQEAIVAIGLVLHKQRFILTNERIAGSTYMCAQALDGNPTPHWSAGKDFIRPDEESGLLDVIGIINTGKSHGLDRYLVVRCVSDEDAQAVTRPCARPLAEVAAQLARGADVLSLFDGSPSPLERKAGVSVPVSATVRPTYH